MFLGGSIESIRMADYQLVMRNMFKNIRRIHGYDVDLVEDGNKPVNDEKLLPILKRLLS